MLHMALGFNTWRALVVEAGMSHDAAADVMARATAAI